MRSVKPTMHAVAASALLIAAWAVGCGAPARPSGAAGSAGAAMTAGAAGSAGGSSLGAAGAAVDPTGVAGAGDPTGAAGGSGDMGTMPGTVPSGAGGTIDQGRLFTDAATVSTTTNDDAGASTKPEAAADTGKSVPGDGNTSTCHVGGMNFVLVFTQKGTDVTMVVTATNCPAGSHTIQIHGGFSCDNAGTEGGVWDGQRGAGIPALTCANNKGSLTYTRSGADATTSWTVGDHATKTDVTLHPMSVDTSCGTFF